MVDLLELGFLEADDERGWLREGEADIVAIGGSPKPHTFQERMEIDFLARSMDKIVQHEKPNYVQQGKRPARQLHSSANRRQE
jgi:hypothetical protein